jgi:predicted membrane protein DUF2306
MDLLWRRLSWLVRFALDRAAFTDRWDRFFGIFRARRGVGCSDWLAARFILRGDAIRHRRWMIRSYALTAAITLRIHLPLIFAFHWPFRFAYPAIAWLCWIPNALAAEVYLRFVPTPSRITLPATWAGSSPQLP